jgi:hypothetical protein
MNSFSTDRQAIRKFGAIGFVFFGILFSLSLWRQRYVFAVLFGFFTCLSIGFLLLPSHLRPVYEGWLRISHLVGRGMTFVILTVAYYVVITPTALIKRFFGGRPLPTSPNKAATSYWVTRSEAAQPKERFVKRY